MIRKMLSIAVVLGLLAGVAAAPTPAHAAKPIEKWVEHEVVREVTPDETAIFIGVYHVSATFKDAGMWDDETSVPLLGLKGLNMSQNLRLFEWDPETEERGQLLAVVEIRMEFSGEVTEDFFGGDPLTFEGIVNGHLVVQWHIKDFTEEGLPVEGDLHGLWNYWFENGDLVGEKGWGEFPVFP